MSPASAVSPPIDARPPVARLLPSWRFILVLYTAWLVPAAIFTGRATLIQDGTDLGTWARSLTQNLWYWLYWASICPLVYRVWARRPIRRGGIARALPTHIGAALATALGIALLAFAIRVLILRQPMPVGEILARELISRPALGSHLLHFGKYWMVLGAMALIHDGRLRRDAESRAATIALQATQLEAQLAGATLQSLRGQLRPHFLFNALNSVAALVESRQSERAFRMIGELGGLLRQSLRQGGEQQIALSGELDLVRRYLELEGLRYGDRLEVRYDVPADLGAALVPALVLQPLVENAVRHAVARQVAPVTVSVSVQRVGERLSLIVEDDGPGLATDWHAVSPGMEPAAGLGLRTTAERLRLLYGGDHAFAVTARASRGTRCRIDIPLQIVDAEPDG